MGDVRGKNFMMCVENVANKDTKEVFAPEVNIGGRIADHAQARGVIVRPVGHLNVMSPPLIMTREQVDTLVDVLRQSIEATLDDLRGEGLWQD